MLSRADANTSLFESFTYDRLSRLTSATVSLTPTPLVKTFSYDPIGNLPSKTDQWRGLTLPRMRVGRNRGRAW
jgi:hypothetical protein